MRRAEDSVALPDACGALRTASPYRMGQAQI
jgi:hypothetical protein